MKNDSLNKKKTISSYIPSVFSKKAAKIAGATGIVLSSILPAAAGNVFLNGHYLMLNNQLNVQGTETTTQTHQGSGNAMYFGKNIDLQAQYNQVSGQPPNGALTLIGKWSNGGIGGILGFAPGGNRLGALAYFQGESR